MEAGADVCNEGRKEVSDRSQREPPSSAASHTLKIFAEQMSSQVSQRAVAASSLRKLLKAEIIPDNLEESLTNLKF